jgi:hypothetical protein
MSALATAARATPRQRAAPAQSRWETRQRGYRARSSAMRQKRRRCLRRALWTDPRRPPAQPCGTKRRCDATGLEMMRVWEAARTRAACVARERRGWGEGRARAGPCARERVYHTRLCSAAGLYCVKRTIHSSGTASLLSRGASRPAVKASGAGGEGAAPAPHAPPDEQPAPAASPAASAAQLAGDAPGAAPAAAASASQAATAKRRCAAPLRARILQQRRPMALPAPLRRHSRAGARRARV